MHIDDSCIKSQSGVLEPEINNSSEEPEQESIVDGTETTASQIDCISTQLVGINEILGKAPWGNKKQKKLNELENELLYIKRGLRKIIKSLGKYNMATHENVEQVHLLHLSKIIKYAINLQGNIGNI
ncbi:MAG: hypothetical protein JKX76_00935 [Colwellia sp.]|nr:hypothetical protein [Colwellia sp.]